MKNILNTTGQILFALFLLVFFNNSFAQRNNPQGISVNVIGTTPTSTTLEFVVNNYETYSSTIDGREYVDYYIPGSIFLMEKGLPQLPTHRVSIVIPDLAGMNFRIVDQNITTIETRNVAPSKGHLTRNIDPSTVPYTFSEFYQSNTWYPQNNISLDEPYIIRDLRGQTVQFNPMQYNPAEGKLKICTRMLVEVYSDANVTAENTLQRSRPLTGISKEFSGIYSSLFINFGFSYYDYVPLQENGRLLIVYPTAFASNIIPFVQWKQERGLQTLTAEYPTATGTGTTALKSYIQNLYNSAEGLTFIIFVGESNQIPTISGQYEGAPSDPCYVKLAGTDAYPDAFISRISPSSATNLDYVLHKLIRYEKFPDTGPAATWYLKGVGVASNEGSPPDYTRASWLKAMLIDDMYFTQVDEIYDPGATSSMVTTSLNNGRSIINYIGHGSGTSWSTTGFGVSTIHQLANGYKNPFILDVACMNGDFTMTECMEEAWIRAGDMANPKGAIAVYGSSTNASWVPPCDMQNHAVSLLTNREMKSVGGVCFNGLMHGMDLWGGSSGEGLKMMEQYNIFGDCTMLLTFGLLPDSTAPEQITDLAAANPTSNSIMITWTSPYDSSLGGVVSYDLRYSNSPIVTDIDFQNATSVIVPGGPDSAGIAKSYELKNLSFSTTYYVAIKATDIWGNKSEMSNVPSIVTWDAPLMAVNPDSLNCSILPGTTHTEIISISNISAANSTLDYSITFTNNTFPGNVAAKVVDKNKFNQENSGKNPKQQLYGTSQRGSGGPDTFGYEWIDSNDPNGPGYVWNDISATGTLVTNWIATSTYSALDEGKAGPFNLGFSFKYYGVQYSQVYFCSNGFISFTDITDAGMTNAAIPGTAIPNNLIAPLWDDLDGKTTGKVYYKAEADKFIVQYKDWPGYYSGTGPFTFQVVLYKSGKIILYYNTILGTVTSCTVGIENQQGNDGLQVVRNAAYLQNNLALQFSAEPDWLASNNYEGRIYNGNSVDVQLTFTTDDLDLGDYSMDMEITTNDPLHTNIVVPVHMTITNDTPVELATFRAEQKDDNVVLNWSTASETNNRGFEIERMQVESLQSSAGSQQWKMVGSVEGNGTTTKVNSYSFVDKSVLTGKYSYRLKQIDFDGTVNYSSAVEVDVTGPKEFSLSQNYPNPFNPSTKIHYTIPDADNNSVSLVTIKVYDILGNEVATLVNENKEPGRYTIDFNTDAYGLSSGVYIYTMKAGSFVQTHKMLLMK